MALSNVIFFLAGLVVGFIFYCMIDRIRWRVAPSIGDESDSQIVIAGGEFDPPIVLAPGESVKVEIQLSPEVARRFAGLPDITGNSDRVLERKE